MLLGQALLSANRKDDAIKEWKRVVQSNPEGDSVVKSAKQLLEENGVEEF